MTGHVMYVDDEELLCRAFALSLRRTGVEIVTFTDAAAALVHIRADLPGVIFCDHRMPRMSAQQLVAALPAPVPFYVVSGDPAAAAWAEGDPRVLGVLGKPFRSEEVRRIVARHAAGPIGGAGPPT